MTYQMGDLFAQEHRQKKLDVFAKVLKQLDQLVNWAELAREINAVTKREAARPRGGRPIRRKCSLKSSCCNNCTAISPMKKRNMPCLIAVAGSSL
ncbi:hypothetical protein [Undibacterium sp.]|uniref:hypothetical protein n=1 Tax=Undibacterium sp. TaxID=1914977 RepID=UPI0025D5B911|nr:hypothetical protein [Undibacterium sp.]